MRGLEMLEQLHDLLEPRSYFEIGVRTGASLKLSRTRSVAVDPAFNLTEELLCDLHLARTTSDEFFAREQPFAHLPTAVLDLTFIDGMHLAEFALRDFINTERFCHPGSVVVFDDVLPRTVLEASRRQGATDGGPWTGDVYKAVDILRSLRPDLVVLELDTTPTGMLVVLNPDPASRVLSDAYDDLLPGLVTPDPQSVPATYLDRARTIAPEQLLGSAIWPDLIRARQLPVPQAQTLVAETLATSGLVKEAS